LQLRIPEALNILLHTFVLVSNKSLLLPNYYVQSSINHIMFIIENIYTASIAEWFACVLVLEFKS